MSDLPFPHARAPTPPYAGPRPADADAIAALTLASGARSPPTSCRPRRSTPWTLDEIAHGVARRRRPRRRAAATSCSSRSTATTVVGLRRGRALAATPSSDGSSGEIVDLVVREDRTRRGHGVAAARRRGRHLREPAAASCSCGSRSATTPAWRSSPSAGLAADGAQPHARRRPGRGRAAPGALGGPDRLSGAPSPLP